MFTKKRVIGAVIALVLAFVGVAVWANSASAHVPDGGASCSGVFASGNNYSLDDTNTLTVSVDNTVKSEHFDSNGYISLPIPQDGVQHHWTWAVSTTNENPNFSKSDSGDITCGHQVHKVRTHVRVVDRCSCRHDRAWMTNTGHVSVVKSHPRRNRFVFRVAADNGYLVHVPGTSGYHQTGKVVVTTGKKPCPCKRNHTCHHQHPHANPGPHCRGARCG